MKTERILSIVSPLLIALSGCDAVSGGASEEAQLVKRLRLFHAAADGYVQANQAWPQCPFNEQTEPKEFADWWKAALKSHGIEDDLWIWKGRHEPLSFLPSRMEPHNFEPFRHHRPWFRTIFTIGEPPKYLAVFPDGSVLEVTKDGELIEEEKASQGNRSAPGILTE